MRKPDRLTHKLEYATPDITLPYAEVVYAGRTYKFSTVNHHGRKRVDSFLTKEPSTMGWIETFGKDDVYVDVGANVGMYVVYAAVRAGCRVYGFEPEALNYAELNKNLFLNGLNGADSRVRAYCCGLLDSGGLSDLYLSRFVPAYSHHDCGTNRWEGPVTQLAKSPAHRPVQGCLAFTLDQVVGEGWVPQPTHVKIDVDGLERDVIAGAEKTLGLASLKTVLVETDFKLPRSLEIMDVMASAGFRYSMDQVCMTRDEGKLSPDEWLRRLAERRGGCNIIYYRDPVYDDLFAALTY